MVVKSAKPCCALASNFQATGPGGEKVTQKIGLVKIRSKLTRNFFLYLFVLVLSYSPLSHR